MRTPVVAAGVLAAVIALLMRSRRRTTAPPPRGLRALPGGHRRTARRLARTDVVVVAEPGGQAPGRSCG
ncbi:hypothetical protein SAMN02982929_04380 [Saccharopolyspora kobensis]|uniref:Uncharacterized protein n=1 Tax=Saccharopolyspora kobensis TaxID=146035 RepID=A0A1H6DFW2_9PSEU|nr:hypothetical protein [Saccharopolyspora kobensis]SEG84139.1 hypothetical protein SAMN02982929_04380 [Saccharopolyspora kobensis]SFD29583.1 hypothetical protein SAMN05216506_103411 [Saccharopolyspora kobensis]